VDVHLSLGEWREREVPGKVKKPKTEEIRGGSESRPPFLKELYSSWSPKDVKEKKKDGLRSPDSNESILKGPRGSNFKGGSGNRGKKWS